jgi:polyisoprenoid-binding protein YceI
MQRYAIYEKRRVFRQGNIGRAYGINKAKILYFVDRPLLLSAAKAGQRYNVKTEVTMGLVSTTRSRFAKILFVMVFSCLPGMAWSQTQYTVDPTHSSVIFRVGHKGISFVFGRFNDFRGTYQLSDDGTLSSVSVTVAATSVDTGITRRDADARGRTFLGAADFPNITFQSTAVRTIDDQSWELTGDLTLHGVTRSITTTLQKVGEALGDDGRRRIGGIATFAIRRSEFGMLSGLSAVLDDIEITIATESVAQ